MLRFTGGRNLMLIAAAVIGALVHVTTVQAQDEDVDVDVAEAKDDLDSETPAAPEPKKSIVLTVWTLSVSKAGDPELDELAIELEKKTRQLPADLGTTEDVRKLVGRLRIARLLLKSREVRLSTLDGGPVMAQVGVDQPQVTGMQQSQRGTLNTIRMQKVGSIIRATPKIDATGFIQINFEYEASDTKKSDEVPISESDGKQPIMADVVTSRRIETAVRLKGGTAMLVGSDEETRFGKDGQFELVILAADQD